MKANKRLVLWTAIMGYLLLWTPVFSQNKEKICYETKKELKNNLKKNYLEDNITTMDFNEIIKIHGKELWNENIKQCFLEEINIKREELGNSPLVLHPVLNELAQSKANDMAQHLYFDHTDKNGLSDAGRMIEDGRYNFQIFMSNISYNITTIDGIIQSYINNKKMGTGHYEVIDTKEYKDLWVGFAIGKNDIWYIVINFGKEVIEK